MIISASRRTDIPAFYSEWFMNRVKEGFCLVQNPFNKNQVTKISLKPDQVDAIVFWSKNPAPFMKDIDELERMDFRFYFQYTLNDYPNPLEPKIRPLSERIATFKQLSSKIGSERVIWRYDPIIISNITNYQFHRIKFENLCKELSLFTNRVMISIVDFYAKTKRNLKKLEEHGFQFIIDAPEKHEMNELLKDVAKIASEFKLDIFTCAEKMDYTELGIHPGRCIDGELIEKLWKNHRSWKKDPNQRKECGCVVSKDIGANDSCPFSCPYCYATQNDKLACERYKNHNPKSTSLLGDPKLSSHPKDKPQLLLFD